MAKCIIGKKIEMTQKYDADGMVIPVTMILAEPCVVTQVKTRQKHGYSAIQLGSGKKKHVTRPLAGHLKGLQAREIMEFRIAADKEQEFCRGDIISVSVFMPGDKVNVTGVSKGKGFQGVVKRHGFSGSPKTHGHKDQLRMPGSSGAGGVQHVFKGKGMPGRMGQDQVTVTNLEVIEVDKDHNMVFVKGAVPGARNSVVWLTGPGEMQIERPSERAIAGAVLEPENALKPKTEESVQQ